MTKAHPAPIVLLLVVAALALRATPLAAQAPPSPGPLAAAVELTEQPIGRFLTSYCIDCHTGEDAEAGLDLESLPTLADPRKAANRWQRVIGQVRFRAMPPADHDPQPSRAERDAVVRLINERLDRIDCGAGQEPARVTLRRLNAAEYDNTLRDLLGIDFRPSRVVGLPEDDVGNGFDNQGEVLSLSPLLLEKYLDAAEAVTQRAIVDEPTEFASRVLLANPPSPGRPLRDALRDAMAAFLPRAYRRPVEANEVERLVDLAEAELRRGGSYPQAVAAAVGAAIVSPHFLFRAESPGDGPLGGYELASRLSYFLWASTPDDTLLGEAHAGALAREATLREQTTRMINDDRARALTDRFFTQWLGLSRLDHAAPNGYTYRKWNTPLREAMREETTRLIRHALREDLGLLELFDAEYTFVNPRLAELYGVDFDGADPRELYLSGPGGPKREKRQESENRDRQYTDEDRWVRVAAPPGRRGLLTHASILTLTSNPSRTSPVKRGQWVLETVLGDPPPPAPESVPDLAKTAAQAPGLSLREQLELHRRDPACAGCHERMDAIGLAFENFDPIGARRDKIDGRPIDASGELDGERFHGSAELIALVRDREEEIARQFARRLLVYALGRGLRPHDRCVVDDIVAAAKADNYKLSTFIAGVATSKPFRQRGAEAQPPTAPQATTAAASPTPPATTNP